jgi:hypothetical protein
LVGLGTIPGWRILGFWVIGLALEFLVVRATSEGARPVATFPPLAESLSASARSSAAADSDEVLSFALLVRHVRVPHAAGRALADTLGSALQGLRAVNRESLWAANRLPAQLNAAQHDSLLRAVGTMLVPLGKALGEVSRSLAQFLLELLAVPATLAVFTVAWLVARRRRRGRPGVAAV